MSHSKTDGVSVVLAGEAGQGIQSIESILTALLKQGGFHVFAAKEYMSRVRGGTNSVEIVVSSRPAPAFVDRIDLLLPLSAAAVPHLAHRMGPDTVVVGDAALVRHPGMIDVPFQKLAAQAGGALMANTLAAGLVSALFHLDPDVAEGFLERQFARKSQEIRDKNKAAFRLGWEQGLALRERLDFRLEPDPAVRDQLMLTGNEAVALGALAGGVQYVVAYPMSPGTTVIELLAAHSKEFDVLVEQVEDEVGVVNMALGAWFAGARTLVTTSGGGFALMVEGVSLAGMAEIPLVVHLAQRPGPATGLPTRTLQGDLFLAAFAGHGDFPRLVLAPGTLEEAWRLSAASFELADRYQVPVFLLTDQYLLDSYYNTPAFNLADPAAWADGLGERALRASRTMEAAVAASPGRSAGTVTTRHDGPLAGPGLGGSRDALSGSWIVPTTGDYQRARLTADGFSPRGIPGYGSGVVTADSDEHDETGHITENLRLRNDMVHKRAAKTAVLAQAAPLPEWIGPADAPVAVLGWGSTRQSIAQALALLARWDPARAASLAQIHFVWVNPLPEGLAEFLSRPRQIILVENNEAGWLGKLIRLETGIHLADPVLRYDGLPFSVEGLARELAARLGIQPPPAPQSVNTTSRENQP